MLIYLKCNGSSLFLFGFVFVFLQMVKKLALEFKKCQRKSLSIRFLLVLFSTICMWKELRAWYAFYVVLWKVNYNLQYLCSIWFQEICKYLFEFHSFIHTDIQTIGSIISVPRPFIRKPRNFRVNKRKEKKNKFALHRKCSCFRRKSRLRTNTHAAIA